MKLAQLWLGVNVYLPTTLFTGERVIGCCKKFLRNPETPWFIFTASGQSAVDGHCWCCWCAWLHSCAGAPTTNCYSVCEGTLPLFSVWRNLTFILCVKEPYLYSVCEGTLPLFCGWMNLTIILCVKEPLCAEELYHYPASEEIILRHVGKFCRCSASEGSVPLFCEWKNIVVILGAKELHHRSAVWGTLPILCWWGKVSIAILPQLKECYFYCVSDGSLPLVCEQVKGFDGPCVSEETSPFFCRWWSVAIALWVKQVSALIGSVSWGNITQYHEICELREYYTIPWNLWSWGNITQYHEICGAEGILHNTMKSVELREYYTIPWNLWSWGNITQYHEICGAEGILHNTMKSVSWGNITQYHEICGAEGILHNTMKSVELREYYTIPWNLWSWGNITQYHEICGAKGTVNIYFFK